MRFRYGVGKEKKLIYLNYYSLLFLLGKLCSKYFIFLGSRSGCPCFQRPGCTFRSQWPGKHFQIQPQTLISPLHRHQGAFCALQKTQGFPSPASTTGNSPCPSGGQSYLVVSPAPAPPPWGHHRQGTERSRPITEGKESQSAAESEETGFADDSWNCVSLRKSEWTIIHWKV